MHLFQNSLFYLTSSKNKNPQVKYKIENIPEFILKVENIPEFEHYSGVLEDAFTPT